MSPLNFILTVIAIATLYSFDKIIKFLTNNGMSAMSKKQATWAVLILWLVIILMRIIFNEP